MQSKQLNKHFVCSFYFCPAAVAAFSFSLLVKYLICFVSRFLSLFVICRMVIILCTTKLRAQSKRKTTAKITFYKRIVQCFLLLFQSSALMFSFIHFFSFAIIFYTIEMTMRMPLIPILQLSSIVTTDNFCFVCNKGQDNLQTTTTTTVALLAIHSLAYCNFHFHSATEQKETYSSTS